MTRRRQLADAGALSTLPPPLFDVMAVPRGTTTAPREITRALPSGLFTQLRNDALPNADGMLFLLVVTGGPLVRCFLRARDTTPQGRGTSYLMTPTRCPFTVEVPDHPLPAQKHLMDLELTV